MREALESQLSDYSGQITEKDERIKELESQIAEKDNELAEISEKLTAAEDGLEHLKELYSQQAVFDVNAQYDLVNNLIWLLRNPPTYTVEIDGEPETDEEGEPVLDEEGNPVIPKITKTYSYSISLYYEDLLSGHKFSWNADTSWHTASLIKLPFTLSVLEAASDYAEAHPEEYAAMMAAYEEYKAGLGQEITEAELPPADDIAAEDAETQPETQEGDGAAEPEIPVIPLYQGTDYPYDFNREFAYFASQSWQAGSGKIQNAADGTVYTMAELFQYLLLYSDNVAYYQLKEAYDTVLQRDLVSRLGLDAMSKSLAQISAHSVVEDRRHHLTPAKAALQRFNDLWSNPLGPKKLLEIERMHRHLALIADRNGFRLHLLPTLLASVLDPEKRTRGNDVISSIQRKRLKRSPGIGTFLYLVQEDQRLPGD